MKQQILIVDGYNMIGAWPNLIPLKEKNEIEEARDLLLAQLSNYAGYEGIDCWVVFDAMFVPGLSKSYDKYNLHVVFTAEGQTADSYIEAMIENMTGVLKDVTVATSDLAEQRLVFQKGAVRKSALELYHDVRNTENVIRSGQGHENYLQEGYRRGSPWTYQQLRTLKGLLKDLSQDKDNED